MLDIVTEGYSESKQTGNIISRLKDVNKIVLKDYFLNNNNKNEIL